MEKMSGSKPTKQARTTTQSAVTRTESVVDLTDFVQPQEGSDPLTTSQLPSSSTMRKTATPPHPRGHKVRELKEVWDTMDSQAFLHLTDTITLSDVWVQPKTVEPSTGMYTSVTFIQIVLAPHIKRREAVCKMAVDDLLQMLFLNDCILQRAKGLTTFSFDDWLAEKTAAFVKKCGVSDSTNRAKLCNFIIVDDKEFTFYPAFIKNTGVFFRKVCYHSYKDPASPSGAKMDNPSMVKCRATRGKFEYMIEARLIPIPPESWWGEYEVVPPSQPY